MKERNKFGWLIGIRVKHGFFLLVFVRVSSSKWPFYTSATTATSSTSHYCSIATIATIATIAGASMATPFR